VNARHHANEVSGTNAAFMLLRTLLSVPAYAGIADSVNIVVVPFENADGAAMHCELARDNPEWILHIARYNSLGKELALEYWNDSTMHTEAMAFTRVWRDWLPDVVTDNHDVPSHELNDLAVLQMLAGSDPHIESHARSIGPVIRLHKGRIGPPVARNAIRNGSLE
jgi:hypothetical protein